MKEVNLIQTGYNPSTGKWGVDTMITNKGKVTFTLPSCIAAGQYLLRHEIIGSFAIDYISWINTEIPFYSFACCLILSRCPVLCSYYFIQILDAVAQTTHILDGVCSAPDHRWRFYLTRYRLFPRCLQVKVSVYFDTVARISAYDALQRPRNYHQHLSNSQFLHYPRTPCFQVLNWIKLVAYAFLRDLPAIYFQLCSPVSVSRG